MDNDNYENKQDDQRKEQDEEIVVGGNDQFVPVNRKEQNNSNEEMAGELTLDDDTVEEDILTDERESGVGSSTVIGWSAIVLSVLSFFMMPFILGIAGIVVGFIAKNKDKEWLGNTAIIVGAASVIISMFVLLFR